MYSYDVYDYYYSRGDIRFIWLFGAIACFILVIASINFINLSTARSANRAKEVGLRKVVGSYRSTLIAQFLTESILYSFCSFALGVLLAWMLLPYFSVLSGQSFSIPWNNWWLVPLMILVAALIGVLAGLYPSFYLSAFNPIQVLKGQLSKGSRNITLRNVLVIFQFATSVILIISTLVIDRQMKFILHSKAGFDKDQVILIEGANNLGKDVYNLKTALLQLPFVKSVSVSDYLPVSGTKRNGNSFYNEGKTTEDAAANTQFWQVDEDYIKTMGLQLLAGRNFSPAMKTDSQSVIINQSLAAELNLKDPVGKRITNSGEIFQVIGVVKDFNFESFRNKIGGLCLHLGNSSSIMSVKVNAGNISPLIASITAEWKKFAPAQSLRYAFLDERFAAMYADVQRANQLFTSFAVLAIIIACLGLFALSAFMAEQRNREIGVRKVLGASVGSITGLLSKDFVRLVIIAIIIASPIAWWVMNQWLQGFAYRLPLSWWIFALAAAAALFIALVTISFQSIKAAMANPVESLKAE